MVEIFDTKTSHIFKGTAPILLCLIVHACIEVLFFSMTHNLLAAGVSNCRRSEPSVSQADPLKACQVVSRSPLGAWESQTCFHCVKQGLQRRDG